jgi:hypothetical protein
VHALSFVAIFEQAIMSLYTGEKMEEHIQAIIAGGPLFGYDTTPRPLSFGSSAVELAMSGIEDRNRTAVRTLKLKPFPLWTALQPASRQPSTP